MTDFLSGASTITEGSVFDESDDTNQCIISSELAEYNDLSVGDTITLVNPNATDETYELLSAEFTSHQTPVIPTAI